MSRTAAAPYFFRLVKEKYGEKMNVLFKDPALQIREVERVPYRSYFDHLDMKCGHLDKDLFHSIGHYLNKHIGFCYYDVRNKQEIKQVIAFADVYAEKRLSMFVEDMKAQRNATRTSQEEKKELPVEKWFVCVEDGLSGRTFEEIIKGQDLDQAIDELCLRLNGNTKRKGKSNRFWICSVY